MSKTLIYLMLIFALWCFISFGRKAQAKQKGGSGDTKAKDTTGNYSGGGSGGGSR